MRPFKLIRKLLQVLKSEATPAQIAFGVAFGALVGFTPWGWGWLVWLSLALLFNVSLGAVSLSFAVFKLLYFPLRPAAYALGFHVLEGMTQLDSLWSSVFYWPGVAWMRLNEYLVFGGVLLALLVSAVAFPLVVWGVRRYRVGYGARLTSEWLKRLGGTWWGRILRWLAAGGEARFQARKARAFPLRLLRWQMLFVLPVCYGLVYVASAYAVPFFASTLVTAPTSLVTGGEARVTSATYDPLSGELAFEDFAVADPKKPDENLLVVGRASLDVGLVGLLQRRAVINRASVASIELHVKREPDGSLNLDNAGGGWDASGYLEWAREHADQVDWVGLLKGLWEAWWNRPPRPAPEPQPDLSGGRAVPRPHPWFALERVGAERFELTLTDEYSGAGALPRLSRAELVLEHVELDPRRSRRPMTVALRGELTDMPGATLELRARFEPLGNREFRSTFNVVLRNVDLTAFRALYARTLPVSVLSGTASFAGELTVERDALGGATTLQLENLRVERKPERPTLFGFDPTTSGYLVQGINAFAAETPIAFSTEVGGTTAAPEFGWDAAFVQVAIRGLERGANVLLRPYIELLRRQLEALGGGRVELELDPDDGVDTIQELLRGIFGGSAADGDD